MIEGRYGLDILPDIESMNAMLEVILFWKMFLQVYTEGLHIFILHILLNICPPFVNNAQQLKLLSNLTNQWCLLEQRISVGRTDMVPTFVRVVSLRD